MDHKTIPYQKPEDLVAAAWTRSGGTQGGVHDVAACGIPAAPNIADLNKTTRALKLMVADPCPEVEVLLSLTRKLMESQTAVASIWGGPTDGNSWIFSAVGLPTGVYPWEQAACPWDLLVPYPALMVIEDMAQDARTAHLPHTVGLGIHTYLSAPIIASDGHRIGSFCMMDFIVHKVDIGRCRLLTNFAELASRALEQYADVQARITDPEDLVCKVYTTSTQTLKRNLASSYDSCIMIIDVSNNFEVLYINESWVQWSGGITREDTVGRHLPDLLDSVTTLPLSWSQIASETVGGARFIIPLVRARNAAAGPVTVFDISFRCGALEALDNDTLPIALPTFVDMSTRHGGIYFGRLHVQHDSSSSYHPLQTTQSASAVTMTAAQMARLVIPQLKLGHVLGQGGFATAYVADWHDTRVVCKVQDHILRNDQQRALAEGEILLGQELTHPNVIRTLAHGTIQLQRPLPRSHRAMSTNFLETLADMVDFHVDDFDECDLENYGDDSEDDGSETSSRKRIQYINLNTFHDESGDASQVISFPAENVPSAAAGPSTESDPLVVFTSVSAASPSLSVDSARIDSAPMVPHTPWGLPVLREDSSSVAAAAAAEGSGSGPAAAESGAAGAAAVPSAGQGDDATATDGAASEGTSPPAASGGALTLAEAWEAAKHPRAPQTPLQTSADADGGRRTPTAVSGGTAHRASGTGGTNSNGSKGVIDFAALPRLHGAIGGSLPASLPSRDSAGSSAAAKKYPVELRTFLVLEFCDKGCLQDAIDRGWLRERPHCAAGPVAPHVVRTALDVAEGMLYLHSKNIIHGDLSPFNVLLKSIRGDAKLRGASEDEATVDQYGRPFVAKVADFGTSRRLPVAQEYIRTESYGTVTHMPPEMLVSSQMGFACDVWAFGVMLWSMWTGSHPWCGLSHIQIVTVVVENSCTLQWPPNAPPRLTELGKRCLAHAAADRPTFGVICAELRLALADVTAGQAPAP